MGRIARKCFGEVSNMKSPFPGMDPYLEAHWGDIHATLIVYARNQLNAQLPDDLQARVEEDVAVTEDGEKTRTVYPDVGVVEQPGVPPGEATEAAVSVAEPILVTVEDQPRTLRHLEIVDTSDGGRVVTAIELLSPANKVGSTGQLIYIRKQRNYLDAGVNLMEVDLIRAGNYVLAIPEDRLPAACRTPYLACIRRAARWKPGRVVPDPSPPAAAQPPGAAAADRQGRGPAVTAASGRLLSGRPVSPIGLSPGSGSAPG